MYNDNLAMHSHAKDGIPYLSKRQNKALANLAQKRVPHPSTQAPFSRPFNIAFSPFFHLLEVPFSEDKLLFVTFAICFHHFWHVFFPSMPKIGLELDRLRHLPSAKLSTSLLTTHRSICADFRDAIKLRGTLPDKSRANGKSKTEPFPHSPQKSERGRGPDAFATRRMGEHCRWEP